MPTQRDRDRQRNRRLGAPLADREARRTNGGVRVRDGVWRPRVWSTTSAAQAHEASWSPSGIVASTARGEHARRAMCVADEPPRLAPDSLIERVGMPDLGRNRRAAMYTKGAKADVAFCPKGTAPGRHRRTSLAFG